MKIILKLRKRWKLIVAVCLIFVITSTGFYYVGRYSRRGKPYPSTGESLSMMVDFSFTCDVEIFETSNITRSAEELEWFARTYIVNSSKDYSKDYLTAMSLYLLINGGPRIIMVDWKIGVRYAGFLRHISSDYQTIVFDGNSTIIIQVYQNLVLRAYNFTVANIEYIFTNISVEERFIF
jgi:hypothetical protein